MKQVRPTGGIIPLFVAVSTVRERGQHVGEVGPISIVAKVDPSAHSSILAKWKWDDGAGPSGR